MRIWPYDPKTSRDNWQSLKENVNSRKNSRIENWNWLSDEEIIEEWLDNYTDDSKIVDYYDIEEKDNNPEDQVNSEGYIIEVEWKVKNVLEYNDDGWVESFNAGKFWYLAFSDKISNYQKDVYKRFFKLLDNAWKLSIKTLGYKLNRKSILQVDWNKGGIEFIELGIFLKYLWWNDNWSQMEDYFIKKIEDYNINFVNKTKKEKITEINFYWSNQGWRAA